MKYILICPSCGRVYRANSEEGEQCPHCGTMVVFSGTTEDVFDRMAPDAQQKLICKITGTPTPNTAPSNAGNGWASLLDAFVNFALVIGLLASVVGGLILIANAGFFVGLMVLIGGVVVTLLSVGIVKLLLGAANDIRFIRSYYERKN